MWTGVFLGVLALAACDGVDVCKCSKSICNYYSELNCTPVYDGTANRPVKFDCGTLLSGREPGKCYLDGKTYGPGSYIGSEVAGNPCIPECRCMLFGELAYWQCVSVDCPWEGPLPPNCVPIYESDRCCSSGTFCTNTTRSVADDSQTCQYDGKSYVFGQKFFPKEDPCKTCICQQGFDGTLNGPWCTYVSCRYDLFYGGQIREGCAPIFYGAYGCCPIDWRCPEASDTVVPAATTPIETANKCSFGNLTLNIGDTLSKKKECVECKCTVPPLMSCLQCGNC